MGSEVFVQMISMTLKKLEESELKTLIASMRSRLENQT
jgi:hypothetical protein